MGLETIIFTPIGTHTLEMKKHIRSIVLEHLGNQFNVHVLDVDLLWKMVPALAASPRFRD